MVRPDRDGRRTTYAAFLRGINVGGRRIKMAALRRAFEAWGFENARTFLASGNVLFEAPDGNEADLKQAVEENMQETFGFAASVMLRPLAELEALADEDPFEGHTVTPDTRFYVTFLAHKPASRLSLPYQTPEKDFEIIRVSEREVCSVLTLNKKRGTVDAMEILEEQFGKEITTRNWNTIMKMLGR